VFANAVQIRHCLGVYGVYNTLRNSRQIIARLKKEGWVLVNVRGSHHQFKHPDKPGRMTVPHPKKDLPTGTLCSIFRQAGWPWPE
jgi:predicted RNA binding protein YcfA (HicA-like mRNA interferase family)